MKTLLLLLNQISKTIFFSYFKDENEAINWWGSFKDAERWDILYLKDRKKGGHRYEIECAKFDPIGELYSTYIICYSKKEALILKKKIEEANPNYIINIKNLY